MNKQQLAAKIWDSANKMRSKIEANEYKDYILGFMFYKFLSDKEVQYLKSIKCTEEYLPTVTEDNIDLANMVRQNIGYFISYDNLFSTWLSKGLKFDSSNVSDAISAFNRNINIYHEKVFKDIFKTLGMGLSKLGDTSGARTKSIRNLLNLINDIPTNGKQDYDVIGFIYEYLISNFAANAGKKAGEFYTPHEVSVLISEIVAHHLQGKQEIKIYDPTSGSGSLLINIGKSAARYMGDGNHVQYFAQELKENTYNLTRMNLVMRGILPDNLFIRNADTLEEDWPRDANNYDPLYVDAVVSNPPYSQEWAPADKENDPRFKNFGLAPKGKADFAFLLHDLHHLKPEGIMNIVLPHGVLFRGGEEGTIRRNLIENNHIDAIIGLPANIFFGTSIPTIVMVLKQKRENTDILIIDASKGFAKQGKNNILRACDIKKIVDTVVSRASIDNYSKVVSREQVRENDYNLNIPRYVDSSEPAEHWDIWSLMFGGVPEGELAALAAYWQTFPTLKDALFQPLNEAYWRATAENVKATVCGHADVAAFTARYAAAFATFADFLKAQLMDNMMTINTAQAENALSADIFARLQGMPLVDPYAAYQLFSEQWNGIATDLEILQTEGFNAACQVDPHLVIKNNEEVQDGWQGHVLPFELVQHVHLHDALCKLTAMEEELAAYPEKYEEMAELLAPEEGETRPEYLTEDGSFIPAAVKKACKDKQLDRGIRLVLKQVDALLTDEKDLKKRLKEGTKALHMQTKKVIENLTDAQIFDLLYRKWITPLVDNILALPDSVITAFAARLAALCTKYETTCAGVEAQIASTERELSGLLGELQGNSFDMQGLAELKKLLGGE